jgi:hypothetical protein
MANEKRSGGIGIGSLVFLIFLVLKLAQIGVVATWSWWWITAPLWLPIVLLIVGFVFYILFKALFED